MRHHIAKALRLGLGAYVICPNFSQSGLGLGEPAVRICYLKTFCQVAHAASTYIHVDSGEESVATSLSAYDLSGGLGYSLLMCSPMSSFQTMKWSPIS